MMTVAQSGEKPPIRCGLPISDASRTRRMIFLSGTSRHMSQEICRLQRAYGSDRNADAVRFVSVRN